MLCGSFGKQTCRNVNPNLDQPLIDACRKGDRAAQKAVFELLSGRMMSLCLRYTGGDRPAAEDILQEGFVTLFSKLEDYRGAGSFEGWARRIFVTTALMELRRKDALKFSEDITEAVKLESSLPDQLEDLGYAELMKMVGELPDGFRTVFNLYVVEGYSHKEIARQLGISEVTSRSQLNRAKAALKEKLKKRNT